MDTTVTRSRTASPERWRKALLRALASELAIYQDSRSGAWLVTSQARPGVVHTTDGATCSCEAAMLGGDATCAHRALYWHRQGVLALEAREPAGHCRECSGSGTIRYSTGGGLSDWIDESCRWCGGTGRRETEDAPAPASSVSRRPPVTLLVA